MTHDELLVKVDSVFYEDEGGTQLDFAGFNNQYRALRAVVELHKPHPVSTTESMKDGKWQSNIHCDDCHSVYPCPTIQAIEKELR